MTVTMWVWLGVTALSLILEFVTLDMVSVWFVPAGIVSLILAACEANLALQIVVFIALSVVLILTCRKWALKFLNKNESISATAKDLVGQKYTLLSDISLDKTGTIKINGVAWNVASEDGSEIKKGTKVTIVTLKGNKYIVKEDKEDK